MFLKRFAAVFVVNLLLCGGLFAQDLMDTYFNGDELNQRIRRYVSNVSDLIPDTATLQNVWSYAPGALNFDFWLGAGINGSMAFIDRQKIGSVLDGNESFGADNIDLAQFPDGIPFLPGVTVDLRGGSGNMDFGLTGMWLDEQILSDNFGATFFGEGSSFALRSLGFDVRYVILKEKSKNILPTVTLQGGYFFTHIGFGISVEEAGKRENVNVIFRNDSYLFGAQVSKENILPYITPYAGFKMIISKTNSEFDWKTTRPVMISGRPYLNGVEYYAAGREGNVQVFNQVYAGVGISVYYNNLYNHLVTIGGAYTLGTNHFSINAAVRMVYGF